MYERETTGVGRGPFPRTGSAPERHPSIHRSPGAGVDDAYGRVPIQDAVEVQARPSGGWKLAPGSRWPPFGGRAEGWGAAEPDSPPASVSGAARPRPRARVAARRT